MILEGSELLSDRLQGSHTLRAGGRDGSASRLSAAAGWGHRPRMKGTAAEKLSDLWRHFLFSSELKRASCSE